MSAALFDLLDAKHAHTPPNCCPYSTPTHSNVHLAAHPPCLAHAESWRLLSDQAAQHQPGHRAARRHGDGERGRIGRRMVQFLTVAYILAVNANIVADTGEGVREAMAQRCVGD